MGSYSVLYLGCQRYSARPVLLVQSARYPGDSVALPTLAPTRCQLQPMGGGWVDSQAARLDSPF